MAPGEALEPSRFVMVLFRGAPRPGLLASVPAGGLDPDVTVQPCQARRASPSALTAPRVLSAWLPFHGAARTALCLIPQLVAGAEAARRAGFAVAMPGSSPAGLCAGRPSSALPQQGV